MGGISAVPSGNSNVASWKIPYDKWMFAGKIIEL